MREDGILAFDYIFYSILNTPHTVFLRYNSTANISIVADLKAILIDDIIRLRDHYAA